MEECIIQSERVLGEPWTNPRKIAGITGISNHKKKEKLS
jgi:hypothetical protein